MIFQINASKTWYGHGTLNCFDAAQVEDFFQSEEITLCQTTMLGKASVITYACSWPESAALPMPQLQHALAQNSAQRKQTGAAGPAQEAGEPLALQRLLRVVATREPDSRQPPPWVPWCLTVSAAASPSLCSCPVILSPDARSTLLFVVSV